ncbi:MAG: metallophosphoesterase [Clostridia bacterium]
MSNSRFFTKIAATAVLGASLLAPGSIYGEEVQPKKATKPSKGRPELVFPVMSDIHINASGTADLDKFKTALEQMKKLAPQQDAFAFVGDLTNNGYEEEYDRFLSMYKDYEQEQAVSLFSMGNHDYWNGLSVEEAQERFLEKMNKKSIYYHEVVKGYHFIMLSPEEGKTHGHYSVKQIEWLNEQLKEAAKDDPKKPIFVFLHQHIKDTVYGSKEWGTQDNAELLYDTLDDYPQIITFSGHSHYPLDDPRSIHQRDFTSVGTASNAYMEVEGGKVQGNIPEGAGNIQQGLLVEVYDDEVVINRRDFHNNKWTGDSWVVKVPADKEDFVYTEDRDKQSPRFLKNASLKVKAEDATTTSVPIEFTQAVDNLMVHSYKIRAINKETDKVDSEMEAFSEFYLDPVPKKLSFVMGGLKPGSNYDIEVQAIDSFGNVSKKNLHADAQTQPVVLTASTKQAAGASLLEAILENHADKKVTVRLEVKAPKGWTIKGGSKKTISLAGNKEKTISLEVVPPEGFTGKEEVTITAKTGNFVQTRKVAVYANMLLGENFDGLQPDLKPAVDESIPQSVLGFTHTPPKGWRVETNEDMPQGTTEWQGWSFATKEFWTSADKQLRETFDLASGVVAVADPDEWDDYGSPASKGQFDSTLISPDIEVAGGESLYLGFASHYRQEGDQTAMVEVAFDNGEKQTLLVYNGTQSADNQGVDRMNTYEVREIKVPEGAKSMNIQWRMFKAVNNWFWAIDDIQLDNQPIQE